MQLQNQHIFLVLTSFNSTHIGTQCIRNCIIERYIPKELLNKENELEEKKAQGISKKQQNKQVISCHVTAYTVGDAYTPSDTMANGEKVHVGAVASYDLPLGTKVRINGVVYTVKDRCGVPNTIDIYMNSKQECMRFGKRYMNVEIL